MASTLKNVLVTGAFGLVGNVVYARLAGNPDKYAVYALTRRRRPSERMPEEQLYPVPEQNVHVGDLADFTSVQRATAGKDVVIHMAADPSGFSGWESVLNSNLIGAYHVFEACRLAGVQRIIFASSVQVSFGYKQDEPYRSIYEGHHENLPAKIPVVQADWPTRPLNLYASSKVWGEALAHIYSQQHDMSCICVRIGWVTAEDRPPVPHARYEWCSQRDIAQLIEHCVDAPASVRFDVFYGVSHNQYRWVDIEHARRVVGYEPQDWSEDHLRE